MAVFLFSSIAILVFWRVADKNRLRELLPVVLSAIFLRFLEHFVIINWLRIWVLEGDLWRRLWLPILADVTIWPVAVYFFIQFLPKKKRLIYIAGWAWIMLSYLQMLLLLDVFRMEKGWKVYHSYMVLCGYFGSIYLIWRWLRQKPGGVD